MVLIRTIQDQKEETKFKAEIPTSVPRPALSGLVLDVCKAALTFV